MRLVFGYDFTKLNRVDLCRAVFPPNQPTHHTTLVLNKITESLADFAPRPQLVLPVNLLQVHPVDEVLAQRLATCQALHSRVDETGVAQVEEAYYAEVLLMTGNLGFHDGILEFATKPVGDHLITWVERRQVLGRGRVPRLSVKHSKLIRISVGVHLDIMIAINF